MPITKSNFSTKYTYHQQSFLEDDKKKRSLLLEIRTDIIIIQGSTYFCIRFVIIYLIEPFIIIVDCHLYIPYYQVKVIVADGIEPSDLDYYLAV
jgi:hypothetical protein